MRPPRDLQIIGDFVAITWDDGREQCLRAELLRELSPSAENMGEVDILGQRWGGDGPRRFPGVVVTGLSRVGNYAVTFTGNSLMMVSLKIFVTGTSAVGII